MSPPPGYQASFPDRSAEVGPEYAAEEELVEADEYVTATDDPSDDVASVSEAAPPPALHLPLEDPDEAPEGYPIKGSMRTGTYHSPGSASYDVTVAEIWFASEDLAESNGFTRAE
jgi:uncharacterized protein with LGFP repeats